jgi:hypothetical protein
MNKHAKFKAFNATSFTQSKQRNSVLQAREFAYTSEKINQGHSR